LRLCFAIFLRLRFLPQGIDVPSSIRIAHIQISDLKI
jgi:hypothetical protein